MLDWNYASLVCLRLRFVIFASFEIVDFGFLWDLRAVEFKVDQGEMGYST